MAMITAGWLEAAPAQPPLVLAESPDEDEGSLSGVGASNTAVAPVDTTPLTIPGSQPSVQDLMRRIEQLEGRHQTLIQRLDSGDLGQMIRRAASGPVLDERSGSLSSVGPSNTDVRPSDEDAYGVGYNAGFYIRPDDPEKDPYEIVMNGRMPQRVSERV